LHLHLVADLRSRELSYFQLSIALGSKDFGESLYPEADRVISVVEMSPADRALLDLANSRRRQQQDRNACGRLL
jgi:hypothetical protein